MNTGFLFRGVNPNLHRQGSALQPKHQGAFEYGARYGEATYGGGWTYGVSDANAVIRHELRQEGFPTSGVSTTPLYERAVAYATSGADGVRYATGYVYKIDRERLPAHRVMEYVVSEYTARPSIPEDREVILVAPNGGPLPEEVVVDIIEVGGCPSRKA